MKILQVASEVAPFARTGGLGDVLGALPAALAKLGHEVTVVLPSYDKIDSSYIKIAKKSWSLTVKIQDRAFAVSVLTFKNRKTGVDYWLIKNDFFFGRGELYRDDATDKDYADNDERYILFCKAVLAATQQSAFIPDIIHCHDWQAGLLPILLKQKAADYPDLANSKTLLTIHNLAYQGLFPKETFAKLELPEELFYAATGPLEFYDQVNFLKGAILSADKINTVSETYAKEIQTKEYGAGLEGVLASRASDLNGIINGVDYSVWSPLRDKLIPENYSMTKPDNKKKCKAELLAKAGLPKKSQLPLIGIISRLADQKGFDLIEKSAEKLFAMDLQVVLLGTGEAKYHKLFKKLEIKYRKKLKAFLAFDDKLAHLIEAGSDIFLMPSKYEPCGLNQLYSLKYGSVPIVRKTGGLADSVVDFGPTTKNGTGFVFDEYSIEAMLTAIERALLIYSSEKEWAKLVKRGMKADFSWGSSAEKYEKLMLGLVG